MNKSITTGLGVLTGTVSLIAMLRLVSGASGSMSGFAWLFVLVAMVPWVGYVGWRARHGALTRGAAAAALGLCLVGLASVWLFTLGAVLALACSFAAFGIIWVHDLPPPRPRSETRFVRMEELIADEPD